MAEMRCEKRVWNSSTLGLLRAVWPAIACTTASRFLERCESSRIRNSMCRSRALRSPMSRMIEEMPTRRAGIVVHRRDVDGDVDQPAVLVPAHDVGVHDRAGADAGVELVECPRAHPSGAEHVDGLADGLVSRSSRTGCVAAAFQVRMMPSGERLTMALGEDETMAARCACAPMRASSSLAALLSTRESSSASRSVEAIGDTGLPSPSAAPARISWPIGSAISRPTPKASSSGERQQRRARPEEQRPCLAAAGPRPATAAPRSRPASP